LKRLLRIFDYIFLVRPILMYPVWIYLLAGIWGGERSATEDINFSYQSVILIFVACTLVMGSAYIVNQIQDLDTDRINKKFFLITKDVISVKAAWIEAGILGSTGIVIGFLVNISTGLGLIILLMVAGYFYNFPPLKFKNKPFGGMLINGIGGYIIYALGWSVVYDTFILPVQGIAYIFAVMALYIHTTLPDHKGDKETDKITFSVRFGLHTSLIVALIFEIITLFLALYFRDWLIGIPAFMSLPLFIRSYFKKDISVSLQATKFSIAVLSVMVCIYNIWYAVLVIFVFVITKLYYYKRFNFNYPRLRV